jgi:hypothetical protein
MGGLELGTFKSLLLILGILSLVVYSSGCASTPSPANVTVPMVQTLSDGVMSFNYPPGFEVRTQRANITSEATGWQDLAYLANQDQLGIDVRKNLQASSAVIVREGTEQAVLEASGTILSSRSEINPQGVVVEKSTSQQTDPYTNQLLKYYDLFFIASGAVYHISVYGEVSRDSQLQYTADMIFNSLKLS